MIELDGSYGEGGGALVRTALALSTLTGKEFKVTKIRSGRTKPGLKAQHLTAINALKEICGAETNEIELGTTELHYKPRKIKFGKYNFDIGTAGSISLLLQALILPCMFAANKVTLTIRGGTCGKWQASVDYIQNILLPHLQKFVQKIELKVLKRGYYPKGGGEVMLEISPKCKLKDFTEFSSFLEELQIKIPTIKLIKQGKLEQIRGIVNISSQLAEKENEENIKKAAEVNLKEYEVPINIRIDYANSLSVGGEIVLWTVFSQEEMINFENPIILGGNALIEKGKSSEQVAKEAVESLKKEINSEAAVDHYLTDQLIPFMALIPGSEIVSSNVSNHTKTNIYVVEKFLDVGFKVEDKKISVEKIYK